MIPFLFSSLAMDAIGDSAFAMIEEVRRQFKEKPGILGETETPDYRACVDISTKSALRKMILPGLIAAVSPLAVGFLGGVEMLTGLLAGCTLTGVLLAIFMSNAGGAWDNAKKSSRAARRIRKGLRRPQGRRCRRHRRRPLQGHRRPRPQHSHQAHVHHFPRNRSHPQRLAIA
jgi:K(+)-stimulated pyrophosphate-energized sodium pump